jgi:hypothetical protein
MSSCGAQHGISALTVRTICDYAEEAEEAGGEADEAEEAEEAEDVRGVWGRTTQLLACGGAPCLLVRGLRGGEAWRGRPTGRPETETLSYKDKVF